MRLNLVKNKQKKAIQKNPTLSPAVVSINISAQTNTQIYSAMQILLCKSSQILPK